VRELQEKGGGEGTQKEELLKDRKYPWEIEEMP